MGINMKLKKNCIIEQSQNLYAAQDTSNVKAIKSRRTRWIGHMYRDLIGNLEGMRLSGRPEPRLEDNFKMDP